MFDRSRLILPEEAQVLKRKIKAGYDIIVSDKCRVNMSIDSKGRVFVGELTRIKGGIKADADIRVDRLTTITGNIAGLRNVYIGERCKIGGKLKVEKDLDIGEDVKISPDNIEAKGWVNIRNPINMIVYIFIYLLEMIRRGDGEEVQRILEELEAQNVEDFLISGDFLFIPQKAKLGNGYMETPGPVTISKNCLVRSKLTAGKDVYVDEGSKLEGGIETQGNIVFRKGVAVIGDIRCDQDMEIGKGCTIDGDIYCRALRMYEDSYVQGTIHAQEKIKFISDEIVAMEEKLKRFETGMDDLDSVLG